ncbi:MAG: threonine synthase [Erysipelotrichaceae bacterium]|nr:threonine synthase [Erysipelotrichaceae bacterium]
MEKFVSSRNINNKASSYVAVLKGLSSDGGLYTPSEIKKIDNIYQLKDLPYVDLSHRIISHIFDDMDEKEISECVHEAYDHNFDNEEITPVVKVNDKYLVELWHGPTCAFKDVALTFLPHLMKTANKKIGNGKEIVILTATSGDTGKAALEGFKDVEGTAIKVLYPYKMVSLAQERQMSTTGGKNTDVIAVKGNFDDCQRMVKEIFEEYKEDNIYLSSANSINIGRLVPQVVYYFKAYFDLLNKNEIEKDELVDFIVPTGNFGDILAGYFAKKMGLPVNKLVCASNENDVLTEFLNTGRYSSKRELYNTMAPSIDILVSSNLERLLFMKSGDDTLVKKLMESLKNNKEYQVEDKLLNSIKEDFIGMKAEKKESMETIRKYYEEYGYLVDTHTAVALSCADKYESEYKKIVLSTASPFKFSKDVYECIYDEKIPDDLYAMDKLSDRTGKELPLQLKVLKDLPVRFEEVIEVKDKELIFDKLRRY